MRESLMSRTRIRAATLLAAVPLLLGLAVTAVAVPAAPASAAAFTQQCDQSGACLNMYGGGGLVKSWQGTTGNNDSAVQWLPGGVFQIRNLVYGGCFGDANGAQGDARMGAGDTCNSASTGGGGDWGTRFRVGPGCPSGWAAYVNVHWGWYVNIPVGNGQQVYLNNRGIDCLQQET